MAIKERWLPYTVTISDKLHCVHGMRYSKVVEFFITVHSCISGSYMHLPAKYQSNSSRWPLWAQNNSLVTDLQHVNIMW